MSLYKLFTFSTEVVTKSVQSTQLFSNLSKGWKQQVRFRRSTGRVRNQKADLKKQHELNHQLKVARWETHLQRMQEQEKNAIERAIERQRKHREVTQSKAQTTSAKL